MNKTPDSEELLFQLRGSTKATSKCICHSDDNCCTENESGHVPVWLGCSKRRLGSVMSERSKRPNQMHQSLVGKNQLLRAEAVGGLLAEGSCDPLHDKSFLYRGCCAEKSLQRNQEKWVNSICDNMSGPERYYSK